MYIGTVTFVMSLLVISLVPFLFKHLETRENILALDTCLCESEQQYQPCELRFASMLALAFFILIMNNKYRQDISV